MKAKKLDQIDIKILATLQENGRITNQTLSERVGLSARPCLERVRRLEASGFIKRYMALLNAAELGSSVMIIAEIVLEHQNNRRQTDFEIRMKTLDEVIDCFEVSGQFDYVARFVCPDIKAYQDLTASLIEDEALGVARIVSNIVLRPIREFSGYPLKLFLQSKD
jgi:DNA-binding Lrp family transcriptional regulator